MATELLPLISYCFVMSTTPGPNNVLLASAGSQFGYLRTLPQIMGTNGGVALQTILACVGLGSTFERFPALHPVLSAAGALYLVFLAWKLCAGSVGETDRAQPLSFAQAVLFQAVNPKSWVKAITLATVFMPSGMGAWTGAILVAGIGVAIGFPSNSMWALFGVAMRRLLTDPRKQRAFNWSMGALLLVLAANFLR